MGSLFKSKKAPAVPPPAAPQIVQDLINGVETVTETRDGQTYTVTRQIPLTAEAQAQKDAITNSINRIDALAQGLAINNPEYAPMVDTLRSWQAQTRGQLFGEVNRAQQDELARRGLGNSTAATRASTALSLSMGDRVQADEAGLFQLAESTRQSQLANLTGALQLRQGQQEQISQAGQLTAANQLSRQQVDNQVQQQNYANQLNAYKSSSGDLGNLLLTAGGTALGAYLGGPAGAGIGAQVGSSLGSSSSPSDSFTA